MSGADNAATIELVVAEDGSIPAQQLGSLGIGPGAHLRVVREASREPQTTLAGSLPDFPDIEWDDFKRASDLAQRDVRSA